MLDVKDKPYTVDNLKEAEETPWWAKDIAAVLQPQSREMLETYAGVSANQVIDHIAKYRRKAYTIGPYPSVGALTWLNPYIILHEACDKILERVKNGATIIDCGCMFAPDLRYLAYKGAPTDKMYAFDIKPDFFHLGFDFYNDRDRWKGTFFAADGLQELDASPLGDLKGEVDIVWAPKFIHLWDRAHQIEVAARMVELLRPVPGSLFCGSQNGLPEPEEMPLVHGAFDGQQKTFFLGNADTLKEMWSEVAARTGTKWNVESRLLDLRTIGLHNDDGSPYKRKTGYNLQWTVTLLETSPRL